MFNIADSHCDAYTRGDIYGNVCNVFCNSKNRLKEENIPRDEGNIHTGVLYPQAGCPNSFHAGKDVVFPAILSGADKVIRVLKMKFWRIVNSVSILLPVVIEGSVVSYCVMIIYLGLCKRIPRCEFK